MINHQWLETFVVLVEEGHFTRTAERLFMTQPGVSQHLKKLEQQVGVCLLNRVGKGFELTLAGERLYRHGVQLKGEQQQLVSTLLDDQPERGPCRFACSGTLAMHLYAPLLAIQQQSPGLTVSLEAAPNQRILEAVLENRVDLGIVTEQPVSPLIDGQYLGAHPLCLVVPGALAGSTPTYEELTALGFIDHPDGEHYARQLLGANYGGQFRNSRPLPRSGFVNQLNQILMPVARGLGFTVLPAMAVLHSPYREQVVILTLPHSVDERLYLIQKKHRQLPVRYQRFVTTITEQLADAGR